MSKYECLTLHLKHQVERAHELKIPCSHLETIVDMIEYYQRLYDLY